MQQGLVHVLGLYAVALCFDFQFSLKKNELDPSGGWTISSVYTLNSEPGQQLLGVSDVSDQKRQNNHVDV